ncbi:MAG TPA: TolC family protein [Nitrospiraceae bacterium]|nr:TolC family protein [Nitrospiraceae bacterium]
MEEPQRTPRPHSEFGDGISSGSSQEPCGGKRSPAGWIVFSVLLLALLGPAWGAELTDRKANEELLTLDQAIGLAVESNRLVKNSTLDVDKAAAQVAATRTRRLPGFSFKAQANQLLTPIEFTFSQGAFGNFPATGPVPGHDTKLQTSPRLTGLLSATVSQPLLEQFSIKKNIDLGALNMDVAAEQLRNQRQTVVANVKRTYFGIVQTRSALESAEESITLYRELERTVKNQVRQQKALEADHLDMQTRLAEAEYNALTLRHNMAAQKEQLNELLGRDVEADFTVTPLSALAEPGGDPQVGVTRALRQRPDVRQARLQVQQAEHDKTIKTLEYLPALDLTFNYVSLQNVGQVLPNQIITAGVWLTWEPFDWGRKNQELAGKRQALAQARNGVLETEAQAQVDVNNRHRTLLQAQAFLPAKRLAKETAQEKLRIAKNRYTQKNVLLKDVLQAQSDLADANAQYSQALSNVWSARADFEKATGED